MASTGRILRDYNARLWKAISSNSYVRWWVNFNNNRKTQRYNIGRCFTVLPIDSLVSWKLALFPSDWLKPVGYNSKQATFESTQVATKAAASVEKLPAGQKGSMTTGVQFARATSWRCTNLARCADKANTRISYFD